MHEINEKFVESAHKGAPKFFKTRPQNINQEVFNDTLRLMAQRPYTSLQFSGDMCEYRYTNYRQISRAVCDVTYLVSTQIAFKDGSVMTGTYDLGSDSRVMW
ncbi:hypothetical protein EVAR_70358_1 [Eumeta japonica]|uniref:Uncharacterized protein n=1 Tax=Eumeta variegata TaxID=151549 RepID=A0A4C2A3B0_EUMVA|nr:hypothetical protein EVAR_70358_1 [Eumeta japonica]